MSDEDRRPRVLVGAQCPLATSIVSARIPLCELPLGIG
jgi:hypothetical protein